MENKKTSDCIAVLRINSPAYMFVQALRSIHRQQNKYDFIELKDILCMLSESHQIILNDSENGVLDMLIRKQIIEQNFIDDLKFQMHPDHWIPFNEYPAEPQ